MKTRRQFLATAAMGTVSAGLMASASAQEPEATTTTTPSATGKDRFRPPVKLGLGGVAIGNGFAPTPDIQSLETLDAAWDAGFRYFDTAPFYGFGLSERRFGLGLGKYPRDEYIISTKVGRLLKPDEKAEGGLWKDVPKLSPVVDYGADATRRSVEDSLQRLGLSRIDIVFIHDLSPDFFGDAWTEKFEEARKGAMVALTKMREEGIIKAWGLGVNRIEPILKTLDVADADIFLSATQYSIADHEDALERLFPACIEKGVSIVVGAPLNAGFLAGKDRFNYGSKIPSGMEEKRQKISDLAKRHNTNVRTAALQFCAAHPAVSSVIPGARSPLQVQENAASMKIEIPDAFWEELKQEKLIAATAPIPA